MECAFTIPFWAELKTARNWLILDSLDVHRAENRNFISQNSENVDVHSSWISGTGDDCAVRAEANARSSAEVSANFCSLYASVLRSGTGGVRVSRPGSG